MVRLPTPGVLVILKALAIGKIREAEPVPSALEILRDKFDSADSYGPQSVALHRREVVGSEGAARIQAFAYARVQALLEGIDRTRQSEA